MAHDHDFETALRQMGSRVEHPPQKGKLEGSIRGAATFLLWAMMRIRSVRYPREIAHVPVQAYCRALRGTGKDILTVGALPPRRPLAPWWPSCFGAAEPTWHRTGKLLFKDVPDAGELACGVREDLAAGGAVPPALGSFTEVTGFPEQVGMRMVSYTSEHTDGRVHRDASAMVHLAMPAQEEGASWRLRVLTATGPVRFRARTEAFDRAGRVRMDRDGGGQERFLVGEDALVLSAGAWS